MPWHIYLVYPAKYNGHYTDVILKIIFFIEKVY